MTTEDKRLAQAKAELSRSRQRHQLHFERTPLAVIEWDLEFRVSEWNPAAERIFGYSRDEAMGRHAAGLIVPEIARKHVDRVWSELCTHEGGLRSTNENNRKDGSIILCDWYNTSLVDEGGHMLGVASLVQDITEQRRAETALQASEQDLRITLDSIGEAVISTDGQGRIVRLNRVAEHLTGWPISESLGRPIDEVFRVIDARTREPIETPVGIVMRERRAVHSTSDARLLAKDGRQYDISQRSSPILDDRGEVVGIALVFRDETQRHALEEQIRRVKRLNALGQLAGGVAHDFNNMLAGIKGYAELLTLGLCDQTIAPDLAELRAYSEGIEQAASTATDLTRKLLAFSRRGRTASALVDVHAAITNAVGLLRRSIDRRISLVTRLEAAHCHVMGDSTQLQNAILNLGINARDAMPDGGELTISTEDVELDIAACQTSPFDLRHGSYVRVMVTDTGIGMSAEIMDQMFDPFFSTKEVGKGTGLGLAAVYGTISDHGGAVGATSQTGRGSRFQVDLPSVALEPPSTTAPGDATQPPAGAGGVLIVDDEPVVRSMARAMVRKLGYRPLIAADGEEGLATYVANQGEIDVVLLDIVMPRMNGRDCFRAIRAVNPNAKVILCSGFTRDTGVSELMAEGLSDFLSKPFSLDDLGQALHSALASAPR